MHEVPVPPRPFDPFLDVVGHGELERYEAMVERISLRLAGRTLWHVNSTAEGGGVAELLRSCLGYLRAGGIDVRWLVVEGDPGFFDITKRIHNRLHGGFGDGGPLAEAEAAHYDEVTGWNAHEILPEIDRGDVVVVHDPQPIGLVPALAERGAAVIWTCHVGIDTPNDLCRSAWDFLRPHLRGARALTFTRAAYVWEELDPRLIVLIPPCIDPFSLKNVDLDPATCRSILGAARVIEPDGPTPASFERADGTPAEIVGAATLVEEAPVPADARLVVQVSRWDRLKDPLGVMEGFAEDGSDAIDEAHLVLAGPRPSSVADDPEALEVLDEVSRGWAELRPEVRSRVHLANLPTDDVEENAVIVNALQRRADVVVQKSLAEGFGLTVTEAMWKRRPIVASRLGGILDQISDGDQGLLVDPRDLLAFGGALDRLLRDPMEADRLADAARERVRTRYLPPHYLGRYLAVIDRIAED
jgi:trehalose synthase